MTRVAPARPGPSTVEVGPRARLTLGPSGGTRGSFHVVVRLLWSTKKGQPVCGSILISQPGGRGSRSPAPLPDAICITGDWVAALMLGRGPPGARSWGAGHEVVECGHLCVADVSGKPAPGTFMN